ARAARGRGAVLRRLGRLGAAARRPRLRDGTLGNGGLPFRSSARAAAGGQRDRTRDLTEEETDDDHASANSPDAVPGRFPGGPRPRRRAAADVGPGGAAGDRTGGP